MNLTELTPQGQKASEITGIILAILFIIAFIVALFIAMYYSDKTTKLREEYIKSLNDHDKAVIMQYKATNYHFKKNNKNEKQTTKTTTTKQN